MLRLREEYSAALSEYRAARGEGTLLAAYDLGHKAIAEHLSLLDMAELHHEVLGQSLVGLDAAQVREATKAAAEFFSQVLGSFEMTLRGYFEAQQVVQVEREHSFKLRRLADAAATINSALSVDKMLEVIAEHARAIIGASDAVINLHLPETAHGAHEDESPGRRGAATTDAELELPLFARDGSALGVMLVRGAPGARFTDNDRVILEQLSQMAAVAIENQRLYEEEREIAHTLQRSLLPERLPELPTVEFAARYVAGKAGTEVGGDWYDIVAVPNGMVGLAMGDVVGRGIAAASLMGQIRNALRAYAFEEPDPRVVLKRLNELFYGWGAIERMATLLYGVFDVETGELHLANAGHPRPIIRKADGSTIVVDEAHGVPLGASLGARFVSSRVTLESGDTLLCYTDGLVEDRQTPLEQGLATLRRSVGGLPTDLEAFSSRVLEQATAGRDVGDDVALLAMRYLPFGDEVHLTLPADPSILKPLRSALRRWLNEAGATDEEIGQVLVATTEACSNVILHAAGPRLRQFQLDGYRNGEIRIDIRDRGRWRATSSRRSGGRGLMLIENLVDHVQITKGPPETVVSMSCRLATPASGGR